MSFDTDTQKQNVVKFFQEVLSNQNFALIPELMTDAYLFNGVPQNAASLTGWIQSMHAAMPGLHFLIESIICEGNTVALRWRMVVPDSKNVPGGGYALGTNMIVSAGGKAITNDQNDLLGHNVLVLANGTQVPLPG
jgi:hypothetical protein